MSKLNLTRTLTGTATVAAGTAVAFDDFDLDYQVDITLPGTETVQLQGSNNGGDTWIDIGSALTSSGSVRVQSPYAKLRLNTTSNGGSVTATAVASGSPATADLRMQSFAVAVKTSGTGAGAATTVESLTSALVQVGGTFSSDTIQLQGSVDGTNWKQIGSDFTDVGSQAIPDGFTYVRFNTSVDGSGTPTAFVTGMPRSRPPLRTVATVYKFVANPSAPTVTPTGTTGSTNYSYKIVGVNAQGQLTAASSAGSTSAGNATLSTGNYNAVSWTSVPGATSYKVYRTVGGAAQGLIGTVSASPLNDTGLTADGTTASTTNGTGLSPALDISAFGSDAVAFLYGTFVATTQMQVSNDGSTWTNAGSAQTAATSTAAVALAPPRCKFARAKMTAYTSGTVLIAAFGTEG